MEGEGNDQEWMWKVRSHPCRNKKEKPRQIANIADSIFTISLPKQIQPISSHGFLPFSTPYPVHQAMSRPRPIPFRRTGCRFWCSIQVQHSAGDVAGATDRLRCHFRVFFPCLTHVQIFAGVMLCGRCGESGEGDWRGEIAFLCFRLQFRRKSGLRLGSWRRGALRAY